MQVDSSRFSLFSPSPFTDYSNDLSDFFHTELFTSINASSSNSPSSETSCASSPQSPFHSNLATPPQSAPLHSFPDPTTISNPSFFNFLEDDSHVNSKPFVDPMSAAPFDFLASSFSSPNDLMGMGMGLEMEGGMGMDFGMGMMDTTTAAGNRGMSFGGDAMGIDPQLVGTPSTSNAMSDFDDEEQDEEDADDDNDADADVSASASPSSGSASSPPVIKSKSRTSKKTVQKDKDKEPEREKLTLTIAPVKVGGHGKARKGTVQSGGVVKRSAATPNILTAAAKDKENTRLNSMPPPALPPPSTSTLSSYMPTNVYTQTPNGLVGASGKPRPEKPSNDDDDEDLPHDWRPSPEVFSKMTSKEKRQLRNKISARNFRVRRKGDILFIFYYFRAHIFTRFGVEYISTLEGDIAERDRLLDAIRSELGSTQSENLALRQEIAALKRTLIEGRGIISTSLTPSTSDSNSDGPILNLPPPAPLPAQSAAALLAQQQTTTTPAQNTIVSTPNFLIPNTQKDVSSTSTNRFWGGVSGMGGMGMGMGGITPVHRVVLPDVSVMGMGLFGSSSVFNSQEKSGAKVVEEGEKLQENINPMLNGRTETKNTSPGTPMTTMSTMGTSSMGAFDGFADVNPFTMKTLDAYRMHLWGKMAAQHHAYQHQQQQQQQQLQQQHQQSQGLTGLASSMRPSYFSSPTLPYSSSTSSLSALLSGKHSSSSSSYHSSSHAPAPPYSPPPPYSSPKLGEKEKSGLLDKLEREQREQRARERETAMYAALASQTLLRRLGSAFWDAFSGGSGAGAGSALGSSLSSGGGRALDEDKVRRVLEGKAVVRVVDVEQPVRVSVGAAVQVQAQAQTQAQRNYEREMEAERRERRETERGAMCKCQAKVTDILEESMRSLSLGKKV
jgi:bZIP-type transcription factor MBZ1